MNPRERFEERRAALIGGLTGTVLEIGAGRGANFGFLRPGTTWIGLEPRASSRKVLAREALRHGHVAAPLAASAEALPLADRSVSSVFGTMVLCSVSDLDASLAEIARVLQPGGSFVFAEHVAAPRGTLVRRLQAFASPFTRRFDNGCNPARETAGAIERSPLTIVELETLDYPVLLGLSVPVIIGRAVLDAPIG